MIQERRRPHFQYFLYLTIQLTKLGRHIPLHILHSCELLLHQIQHLLNAPTMITPLLILTEAYHMVIRIIHILNWIVGFELT